MNPIPLKPGIYWVGALDWALRSFHGYTTGRGATYNAYLIVDEKIALIDTVKAPFAGEMFSRIARVAPPESIDYLISNHVEMDHSGAIPLALERMPKARVITSVQGAKGLAAHYGDRGYHAVKAGDSLSLGGRTLRFVPTPMLHWPDNMLTYCPEERLLFSNDAFGQHIACGQRFDDEAPMDAVMQEAAKYYANIVMPFPAQTKAALRALEGLECDLIAPSHGVIWRAHIAQILQAYGRWSDNDPPKAAVVAFDSMWHSTERMAVEIADAFIARGVPAKLRDLKAYHMSDIATDLLEAKYLAVGSPTLNNNMLPTVAALLTYLRGLAPKGRKGFAFGSYGWGGQAAGQVQEMLAAAGIDILCEKIRHPYVPDAASLAGLRRQIDGLSL
ncbi:MAG: FprA family A-type flavoprotein [Clostridia bacterium]|nr:FprA family A-type flavoprotein [Clostridia bacterium]